MSLFRFAFVTLLAAVAGSTAQSAFATVPYTENFNSDAASWAESTGSAVATWVASGGIAPGGPSGGYITSTRSAFNLPASAFPAVLQARDEFDASNDQFNGNYLASGINHFSTWVWHDT